MSLINEALKKAQRARHAPAPDAPAAAGDPTAQPIPKRPPPLRAQTVFIAFAGAAALIVVSVVITVYLVTRPPPTLATPPSASPVAPRVPLDEPGPVIVVPPLMPALPSAEPAPLGSGIPPAGPVPHPPDSTVGVAPATTEPLAIAGAPAPTNPPPNVPPPATATAPLPQSTGVAASPSAASPNRSTAPVSAAPTPPPADRPASQPVPRATASGPDPRISNFVDTIRVTGIRSSGSESKVLMNDRVYRVNDVVDRALGVTLIKVAPDALTFADANGVIYTKNF